MLTGGVDDQMSGEPLLRVLIGAHRLPASSDQPILIVEAEEDRVQRLRQQLSKEASHAPLQIHQAALAASSRELTWHRFNDDRLNGTLPLERLLHLYPNLLRVHQENLQAHTLAEVLAEWPAATESQRSIELILNQGDPIQALEGAGDWQQRIQVITLEAHQSQDPWLEGFKDWCQNHHYQPDAQQPFCWNRDPLAVELTGLSTELVSLRKQLEEAQQNLRKQMEEARQKGSRQERILEALRHVFPAQVYRERRPDLAAISNDALVDHFINHGIQEGTDLRPDNLTEELQQLREARQQEAARNALLERKMHDTAQQINLLKDMFIRLMANQ